MGRPLSLRACFSPCQRGVGKAPSSIRILETRESLLPRPFRRGEGRGEGSVRSSRFMVSISRRHARPHPSPLPRLARLGVDELMRIRHDNSTSRPMLLEPSVARFRSQVQVARGD